MSLIGSIGRTHPGYHDVMTKREQPLELVGEPESWDEALAEIDKAILEQSERLHELKRLQKQVTKARHEKRKFPKRV